MWFYCGTLFHVFALHPEDGFLFSCNFALGPGIVLSYFLFFLILPDICRSENMDDV